jgi:hypothetical protein
MTKPGACFEKYRAKTKGNKPNKNKANPGRSKESWQLHEQNEG